jgi:hypothetical protein
VVDVLLSGPIPVLDTLQEADVRVLLDLEGLTLGTYQVTPTVVLLPEQLQAVTVRPIPVEVIIERGEPPTATLTPTRTPTPSRTLPPTRRPTDTPAPPPTDTLAPATETSAAPADTPPPPTDTPAP